MKNSKVIKLSGRVIQEGRIRGNVLKSSESLSFFGGVNPDKGTVVEKGHHIEGKSIKGKILVFPGGKGSTVGSYVIYRMKRLGTAPSAIVNIETEAILATGCVISGVPLVDRVDETSFGKLRSGMVLRVNADEGTIKLVESARSQVRK